MQKDIEKEKNSILKARLKSVFEFLRAYNDLRTPVIIDISQQIAVIWLNSMPKYPTIHLNEFIDPHKEIKDGESENDIVLEITRPQMTPCPKPPEILSDWIIPGWTKLENKAEVRKSRNVLQGKETIIENFDDKTERKTAFKTWVEKRNIWASNEKSTWEAIKFFEKIYELYGHIEREGERIELVLGDGIIELSNEGKKFRHPVLLQKLELEFLPEKKQPQFIIRRRDISPELSLDFLRSLPSLDVNQLVKCVEELRKLEFDPLGKEDTSGFLRRLIQGLFPNGGEYVENKQQRQEDVISIERNPVIFMRQRKTGLSETINLILKDIENRIANGEDFSIAMLQILGILNDSKLIPDEEKIVSSLGNEDTDILLSKPANQEQLQIAKQLDYKGTVLVQGPPGTGKTHTIANIIGHLLSQGKRVLVTAQSPKALRVLRQEIVNEIQSLCVSVLQKEKQNLEELQKSVRTISVKLSQDKNKLEKEVKQIIDERTKIIKELKNLRQKLFEARNDEIREVVFDGKGIRPIDAAKMVKENEINDSWIPSPVTLGATLPLTHSEITTLYGTNSISLDDERELNSVRPELTKLPSPIEFSKTIQELLFFQNKDHVFGEEFWKNESPSDEKRFQNLMLSAIKAINFFNDSQSWQMEAVQAGRDGGTSRKTWENFSNFIESTWSEIQELNSLIMEYGPTINDSRPNHQIIPIVNEIVLHLEKGKSLGFLTKISKKHWHAFLDSTKINGKPTNKDNKDHLSAIQAKLKVSILRDELKERWERMMVSGGAPDNIGEKPEQICRQYVSIIHESLNWNENIWEPLEKELISLGFNWSLYLSTTSPELGENAQLLRLKSAIIGDFEKILNSRLNSINLKNLQEKIELYKTTIPKENKNDARFTRQLRLAILDTDIKSYSDAYENLDRLKTFEHDIEIRKELLVRLASHAPAWASAIESRLPNHNLLVVPGDPIKAWEWRQLYDELERRASVSLEDLQEKIEVLNKKLLETTSELVEKQTWLNQIKIMDQKPEARRALNAYATLQSKKTKGGKGKMDETIRMAARREMELAKEAVPVWIMPLNEVIDNFNPLSTRFDVVIIDEASQSDPLAMFALYLGQQAIIVGDDEQVTPTASGLEIDEIKKLMDTYLSEIPNKEFYDGQTSIYNFAQTAFGNVIRLVEHFRCAPDIIAFSNSLSYQGDIKPLREESSVTLHPNVIAHRVAGVVSDSKVNSIEADSIASLICSAIKFPEYKNKTFGVISLLGDQQAEEIDSRLHLRLSADVYQKHELLCGSPAHFQGDQRDVIFLSMVDSPNEGPLSLRDADANRKLFKKRYNVAASRAKDQMWLVHSLNHENDLKAGDIRKRLIEHMIDPKAWQRQLDDLVSKTESPFEEKVLSCLLQKGFKVHPQYKVGSYRIDLVVSYGRKRIAIECDGEQWHGPEKLQEDMDRQAILERLGWKFIRIRGSVFFRKQDQSMEKVFTRLNELGILPESTFDLEIPNDSNLIQKIKIGSQELLENWKNESDVKN